jgi:hypothetical protein
MNLDNSVLAMLSDPSVLASLQNTLTPAGLISQFDAQSAKQAAELARQTQAASQAASAAGTTYSTAAAAPPPQLDPLAQSLPQLTGNVASILTKDPGYALRAHQDVTRQQNDLMTARLQNLSALRDDATLKAKAAADAGDLEGAFKQKVAVEKFSKTMDAILQKQREDAAAANLKTTHQNRLSEIAATGAQARQTKTVATPGTTAGNSLPDWVDIRKLPDGTEVPYLNAGQIKTPKMRDQLTAEARKAGIAVLGDREANVFQLLDSVRGDLQSVTNDLIPKLPNTGGLGRIKGGAANRWNAIWQNDAVLSGYPAYRTAAIKTIQTLAALGKGLRINQAEIAAAQNFDYPRIDDNQATAKEKFRILGLMLDHMEKAALGHPPSQAEVDRVLSDVRKLRAGGSANSTAKTSDPLGIR